MDINKLPKLKYYEQPINNIYDSNVKFIDRNSQSNIKKNDISDLLLNRQFANFNIGTENESKLRYPLVSNDNCSKKEINWSNYYFFPTGKSGGNPNEYDKTYVGLNTRNDPSNLRDIDLKEHPFVPLDSFRINYGGLKYEDDLRNGVSTRSYRKSKSNN